MNASSSGNLPSTTVTVPSSTAAGSYTLTATGATSGRSATAGITVNAVVLSLSPSTVTAGSAVTISGSGFVPNEPVGVTLNGQGSPLAVIQSDGSGNLPATAVAIPSSTATCGWEAVAVV